MEQINALLDKYDHFKDAQFNSIQKPDDDTIIITLAIQDDDGMDTDHVKLTFTGIKNARLMANNMLAFLDMMSGISIVFERGQYAFAIGKCGAMLNVLNSPFFVIADKLEMEETAL